MRRLPVKYRSLITPVIGFAGLFGIVFVLLYGCGYAALQYQPTPSATVTFSITADDYSLIKRKAIKLSNSYKMHIDIRDYMNGPTFTLGIFIYNKNYDIFLSLFKNDPLQVAFNKSRIPGLRPTDAQMDEVMQKFITMLTAIDGVELKKIEYFDRKGNLIRTRTPSEYAPPAKNG